MNRPASRLREVEAGAVLLLRALGWHERGGFWVSPHHEHRGGWLLESALKMEAGHRG